MAAISSKPLVRRGLGAAGLACILLAWGNSLPNAFHFDDASVLENNAYLRSLGNVPRFFLDSRTYSSFPGNCTYRPLVSLSLALDYALGRGLSSPVFHASQIALLVLLFAALAAFYGRLVGLAWRSPANGVLAIFAATLFSVHAVHSETINLMHVRSEILSALGLVLALVLYLGSRRIRRSGVYLAPMVLGALAKEPAVLLGPILLVLHFLFVARGTRARTRLRSAAKASLPAFVAGALVFFFVQRMAGPAQTYGGGDRVSYALTQTWAWLHYLRLFILPAGLTADTDLPLARNVWDTRVFAGVLTIAALAAVAVLSSRKRRQRPVTFGLLWFALALGPTSTILPLAEPVNDHRTFLPYIGLVLAATWALRLRLPDLVARVFGSVRSRRIALFGCCALPVAALVFGARARNLVWRTDETLWSDVVSKSPGNGRAWMNYGVAFMARGNLAEAKTCYTRALALIPNYPTLEVNLGIVEGALGNGAAAEAHFRRALTLGPAEPAPHTYYARWLIENGRAREALARLDDAIRVAPADLMALTSRMDLLAARGDARGASETAARVLAVDPGSERARAIARGTFPLPAGGADAAACVRAGLLHGQSRRFVDSALAYRAALTLSPDSTEALISLGWTLGRLGFFGEAVAPLRRALELQPDSALARNNLDWVLGQLHAASSAS